MRVALVHERFTEYAGSERVVDQLSALYPDAPVWSPITVPGAVPEPLAGRLRGGALTRYVRGGTGYAHLLPLLPVAMRRLHVGDPDVVVASHHAFASQVVHATRAPVVAYVHSPARWVWEAEFRRGEAGGAVGSVALAAFAAAFRGTDRAAAQHLSGIVANSQAVRERVQQWWGRDAQVVPPPVDTELYTPDSSVVREDFFLLAGRLVPYKRPDLAIRAAQLAGVRLVVSGDGRFREQCERVAGPGTTFLGRTDTATQRDLYRRCAALLLPGVEDFGIVPVEAQACGAPVIAAAAGGALDTVVPGRSGVLVHAADTAPEGAGRIWAQALQDFDPSAFDAVAIREHAEGFSHASFRARMAEAVRRVGS